MALCGGGRSGVSEFLEEKVLVVSRRKSGGRSRNMRTRSQRTRSARRRSEQQEEEEEEEEQVVVPTVPTPITTSNQNIPRWI